MPVLAFLYNVKSGELTKLDSETHGPVQVWFMPISGQMRHIKRMQYAMPE
jgi:hypothetical protein